MARHKDVNWEVNESPPWDGVKVAVLMDLRDELKSLNAKLDCFNSGRLASMERSLLRLAKRRLTRWQRLGRFVSKRQARLLRAWRGLVSLLGVEEEEAGEPFVGPAGRLAQECAAEAGLKWTKIRRINVFEYMLLEKDPERVRRLIDKERKGWDRLFLDIQKLGLRRLRVIVAIGNEALYALTGRWGITQLRGRVFMNGAAEGRPEYADIPVLATVHPAYILRQHDDQDKWRSLFVKDLTRAVKLAAR